jgi:hypothetical protein
MVSPQRGGRGPGTPAVPVSILDSIVVFGGGRAGRPGVGDSGVRVSGGGGGEAGGISEFGVQDSRFGIQGLGFRI